MNGLFLSYNEVNERQNNVHGRTLLGTRHKNNNDNGNGRPLWHKYEAMARRYEADLTLTDMATALTLTVSVSVTDGVLAGH